MLEFVDVLFPRFRTPTFKDSKVESSVIFDQ